MKICHRTKSRRGETLKQYVAEIRLVASYREQIDHGETDSWLYWRTQRPVGGSSWIQRVVDFLVGLVASLTTGVIAATLLVLLQRLGPVRDWFLLRPIRKKAREKGTRDIAKPLGKALIDTDLDLDDPAGARTLLKAMQISRQASVENGSIAAGAASGRGDYGPGADPGRAVGSTRTHAPGLHRGAARATWRRPGTGFRFSRHGVLSICIC